MSLKLRKIYEQDLEKILAWRMLPEVTKYMYTDPQLTLNQQKKWFEKVKTDESVKFWIINIDDVDIGLFNLSNIDQKNRRCEWAYYIADTSFRGRGIGRILECNIYDYVFNVMKMNKLCCEVMTFNEKVISIHEKFGAEVEGTRKQHIYKNGDFHDIVEMAILKEKWKKIKSQFDYEDLKIEE